MVSASSLGFSRDAVASAVAAALPGAETRDIAVFRNGATGFIGEVYFADSRPSVVLKLYRQSESWRIRKERFFLSVVDDRLDVRVPNVVAAYDGGRESSPGYLVLTRLPGNPLRSVEAQLTARQRQSLYVHAGILLKQLHQIRLPSFGFVKEDGSWKSYESSRSYATARFDKLLNAFVGSGGREQTAELISRKAVRIIERIDCPAAVLCHSDFHSGNLLVDGQHDELRISGLLDFESCIAGDPLSDLAKAQYTYGREDWHALLQGYGASIDDDCAARLKLYRLLVGIEIWVAMAKAGNRRAMNRVLFVMERDAVSPE